MLALLLLALLPALLLGALGRLGEALLRVASLVGRLLESLGRVGEILRVLLARRLLGVVRQLVELFGESLGLVADLGLVLGRLLELGSRLLGDRLARLGKGVASLGELLLRLVLRGLGLRARALVRSLGRLLESLLGRVHLLLGVGGRLGRRLRAVLVLGSERVGLARLVEGLLELVGALGELLLSLGQLLGRLAKLGLLRV